MTEFILASNSPRRRDILAGLGLCFKIITADVDESISVDIPPHILVQELALLKGAPVAAENPGKIVISADTVVYHNGKVLGKPHDAANAYSMLKSLSANKHAVYTGICVTADGKSATDYEKTVVEFYPLSDFEINKYIATGEPFDKAGAYGIQGKGCLLVKGIEGDYFNVVGLPAAKLGRLLKTEFNVDFL